MKTVKVVYEPDEDGWWAVSIPVLRGVRSDGRTIAEARRKIREALASATDLGWDDGSASAAEFEEEIHLGSEIDRLLRERVRALDALVEAGERVNALTDRAAHVLSHDLGRSLRDVAELLGLSHGRIHQILAGEPARGARDRRSAANRATVVREQPATYRRRRRH